MDEDPKLLKLNREQRRLLEKQQRRNKVSKVKSINGGPVPAQPNPLEAIQQIDNQLAQMEQQMMQAKRGYAGAYVNIGLQASIALLGNGVAPDEALDQGFLFTEKARAKASAYEKEVRDKAPTDPALQSARENMLEARAAMERTMKEAEGEAVKQINEEFNAGNIPSDVA